MDHSICFVTREQSYNREQIAPEVTILYRPDLSGKKRHIEVDLETKATERVRDSQQAAYNTGSRAKKNPSNQCEKTFDEDMERNDTHDGRLLAEIGA